MVKQVQATAAARTDSKWATLIPVIAILVVVVLFLIAAFVWARYVARRKREQKKVKPLKVYCSSCFHVSEFKCFEHICSTRHYSFIDLCICFCFCLIQEPQYRNLEVKVLPSHEVIPPKNLYGAPRNKRSRFVLCKKKYVMSSK